MESTQFSSLTEPSQPTQSSSNKGKRKAAAPAAEVEIDTDNFADTKDTSPQSRHQRSQGGTSTGSDRRKVRRISAGQGMVTGASTLGEYLYNAVDKLANSAFRANPEATPQAGPSSANTGPSTGASEAYAAIERDEGLSDMEMSTVGEILRKEPDIGTTYLGMSKPSVQTYYIQARLEDYRKQT
jgi:hypothetical protein